MRMFSTNSELKRNQPTVLCIDEGQTALRDRTALLESAGYRVFPAMNVNAAMRLFVSHEIDLVLSSDHLRGVSGAELSIFMKQVKPVSVVLLSNNAQIPANLLSQVDACIEGRPHKGTAPLFAAGTAKAIDGENRQSLIVERGVTELDASSAQCSLAQSDALLSARLPAARS